MRDKLYFSASNRGFYRRSRHGDQLPADAVAISVRRHAELLEGQAAGSRIVGDGKGRPVLLVPPAPTIEQLRDRALKRIRREAGRRIEAAVPIWRQLNDTADLARFD
ncbi:MAG: hypothetical protein JWQ16_1761, partial [Novosphingobium sp.]|nr:hypothetical protein [Novosphingobium sp.]